MGIGDTTMDGGKKMKILKDIRCKMIGLPKDNPPHGKEGHTCCDYGASILELKEEAIRWIKELEKWEDAGDQIPIELQQFYYCPNTYEVFTDRVDNLINWIKHFFSITDKDIEK